MHVDDIGPELLQFPGHPSGEERVPEPSDILAHPSGAMQEAHPMPGLDQQSFHGPHVVLGASSRGEIVDKQDVHRSKGENASLHPRGVFFVFPDPCPTEEMLPSMQSEYGRFLSVAYGNKPPGYYEAFLRVSPREGDKILDWGCGLGLFLATLAETPQAATLSLHGIDLLPDSVEATRARLPHADIRLLEPPGLRTPWEAETFDRVFLLDVIEHSDQPVRLLEEIHRILKPGGLLTISTPDRLAFYKRPGEGRLGSIGFNLARLAGRQWVDPTHVTEHTLGSLRSLLAASPFGAGQFRPSGWHRIPWIRPLRKHFSFLVDLRKAGGSPS